MDIVSNTNDELLIQEETLESEGEIHDFIEKQVGISIGGIGIFLVNSERSTRTGVRADILGLAETGHPIVLELKQTGGGRKGSRTALVQALEYAADFRSEAYQDLAQTYTEYSRSEQRLNVAHAEHFGLEEPLDRVKFTRATEPRIVLLAEQFKASDIDAARYLRDVNDVDITCIEVTPFEIEGVRAFGFETRLQSKTSPSVPLRRADDEALPWLVRRLEESFYERFGTEFDIATPEEATERETVYKGIRFVSAATHPDDLRYSAKLSVYDDPPKAEFGVSPDGHEDIERIIDQHKDAISADYRLKDRDWRRIRTEYSIESVLSDAQLDTVSPEVSGTIGRVLWESEEFQQMWRQFLDVVERWHTIIDSELSSHHTTE